MISQPELQQVLFNVLEEAFERHHGIFLDGNSSLFQTLEGISHAQASEQISRNGATIAAHVAHIIYYLEVLEKYSINGDTSRADWTEVWKRVGLVTEAEWIGLQSKLRETYSRVCEEFRAIPDWQAEPHLSGALAIAMHTAYHLGVIRGAAVGMLSGTLNPPLATAPIPG